MSTNINSTEQIVEINAGDQITNVNIVSQSTTQVISGEQVVTVDVNAGTIPAAWGSITGTLSNQTDLQNALNAKQNNITLTTTGTTGVATLVGATLNIPNYVSSTKQTEWDSAYNDKINSAEVSGTTTKTLTLTQQDGGIIQASWSDFDTAPVTSVFGRTGDVVATEGDYNINQLGDVTITSATNGQVLKYNGTAWVNAADASGLTSVGLAMPSAFTVSGSPLTSNGTITVTGAGTTSQYVRGDGSLAAFPSVSNEAKTLIREVYNKTGATLTKGTVIYIDGGQGNLPTVTKAIATGDPTSAQTFGIVQSDITNMNNGFVVVAGGIDNLDTQAYTEGTALYLSPTTAGAWTSTKPYAPDHMVYLGVVVRSHPTQGVIEVKIQNGVELDEIHDVSARFPVNKDGLFYNSTSGVWENKSIAGVLGYTPVPQSRIITINGTAQDLSADRTYNVGTVTQVAASGGTGISVAGSPVTGSGTITITNTAPDQVVGLTGAGTTSISGTYPNFTITSNDQYTGTVTSVAASGGTGISISGSPVTGSGTINITNTAPDQIVGLTGSGTTSITGTYPNFTINSADQYTGTVTSVAVSGGTGITISGSPVTGSGTINVVNSAPDQIVSLTGAGTTTISGTYPNFTITSNDSNVGTVTSVNATVPTGFEVSGVPITSSGTVDIKFASGYSLPTNAKQTQWDDAYAKRINSLTVTGNSGSSTLVSNVLNVPTYTLSGLGGEPAITAGTTSQYWRGDKTFQTLDTSVVPENGNVYFTEQRVRATVLSGLNITGGSISASDSVLNAFGKVQNQINGLIGGSIFQSTWNASTNTPTLASGVGTKGYYYIVSVAGTTNLDGITDWQIGDWAIFDGTVWRKVDNTDAVVSVNGYTGVVNLVLDDLADVSAASPTDTQLLRFNGTTSKWYNWTPTFLNSLNGITNATQTFATGTSGTDFNISSTGSTHTFNIPSASATNRGLVTTGSQTFAGAKTLTSLLTVTVSTDTPILLNGSSNQYLHISSGAAEAMTRYENPTAGSWYTGIRTSVGIADVSGYHIYSSVLGGDAFALTTSGNAIVAGNITATIPALSTAATAFLVSDSGIIKSRTAAQIRSDINAQVAGNYVTLDTAQTITATKTFGNNANSLTRIIISNTTAGTSSYVETGYISDANSGSAAIGKYSSTTSAYKTIASNDVFLYNGAVAGDITILNDFATGAIKMAAGGSSSPHLTVASTGYISTSTRLGVGVSPSWLFQVYNDADIWHTVIGGSTGELRIGGQTVDGAVIQAASPDYTTKRLLYLQRDGSNVIINGTTDTGDRLQVNGTSYFSSRVGIGASSATYSLQLGTVGSLTNSIRMGTYEVPKNSRQYIGYTREDTGLFEQSGAGGGNTPSTVLGGVAGIRIVNTEGTVLNTKADNSVQLLTHIYNGGSRVALHANYNGRVGINGVTEPAQALEVSGSIRQSGVTSSMLKTNASGDLVAAVAGTDYQQAGNYVTTDTTQSISGTKTFTSAVTITSSSNTPLLLNGTSHQYLHINSGEYEAMTRYQNTTAGSWYTGIRTEAGLADTSSYHIYSTVKGADVFAITTSGNAVFDGSIKASIAALGTAATAFLVSDAGTIKSRTAAQILSDIGAQASGSYVTTNTTQTISAQKTISYVATTYSGTTQSLLIDGAAGNGALTINAAADYAYLTFAQAGTAKIEIGAEGATTNKGSLYINTNVQTGSTGASVYVKKSNAYVGILNIDPTYPLDVSQSVNAHTGVRNRNTSTGAAAVSTFTLGNNATDLGAGIGLFGGNFTSTGQYRANGMYVFSNQSGGLTVHAEGNNSLWLATNNVARLTIDGSGTSTFSGNLFANGLFRTKGSSNLVYWSSAAENASFGAILGDGDTSSRTAFFRSSSTTAGASVWWGLLDSSGRNIPCAAIDGTNGGGLAFWTNTGGSGGGTWVQQMAYNTDGVGIGAAPVSGTSLNVYRDSDIWHMIIGGDSGQLRIGGQTSSGAVIQARNNAGTTRALYLQRDGSNVLIGSTTDSGHLLQVNGTGKFTAPVTITASTSQPLVLNGSTNQYLYIASGSAEAMTQYYNPTAGNWYTGIRTSAGIAATSSYHIYSSTYGGDVFALTTGGNAYVVGGYFESSDIRFKTNIQDYNSNDILNVSAKIYEKFGQIEVGYIAQEIQEIIPSAVTLREDGYLDLSYRQVHTAKIAALEYEIRELKAKLNG